MSKFMKTNYLELKSKHSKEFNSFPIVFAFSKEQLKTGITALGVNNEIPGDQESKQKKYTGMTLVEARAYLESRGLEGLVPGGADTIAKMQGIKKLK